jgi:hypothetical protein
MTFVEVVSTEKAEFSDTGSFSIFPYFTLSVLSGHSDGSEWQALFTDLKGMCLLSCRCPGRFAAAK